MRSDHRTLGYYSLVLLLACSDALAPEDVVGIYTLSYIQGRSLPVVVSDDAASQRSVVGGDLTLASDGQFELRLDEMLACPGPPERQVLGLLGSYRLEGDFVVLRAVGPGVPSDAATDLRLRFRDGVLVVPLGGIFGDVTFTRPRGTGQLVLHTRTTGSTRL